MTQELIVFQKMLKDKSAAQLIDYANQHGFGGYDLAVRPGYIVNPDNVDSALADVVGQMRRHGLTVPMVTGHLDLLWPDQPYAKTLLAAMDQAEVRLLKLGYFRFDPHEQDYWQMVDRVRQAFAGWQELAARYNVKVCYHTHGDRCMGLNAAALMHLLEGCDPAYIGAYLDPLHQLWEGEEFAMALAIVRGYLSVVALKDVMKTRIERHGHGSYHIEVVPAGTGMVDWTTVFADLKREAFAGPFSVHCEFEVEEPRFSTQLAQEVRFFRQYL